VPFITSGKVESAVASLEFVKLSVQCTPGSWSSSTSRKTCKHANNDLTV